MSVLVLVAIVAASIVAAIYLRTQVVRSLDYSEAIRVSRTDAFGLSSAQLDEETGIRGFAVTRDPAFLAPYRTAIVAFPQHLANLRKQVSALGLASAPSLVDRAESLNRQWLAQVATPILRAPAAQGLAIETHGKDLVDRFRQAMSSLDAILETASQEGSDRLSTAIGRTAILLAVLIALVVGAGIALTVRQARAAAMLEAQRAAMEAREREAERLRAAYVAEKHIADTLQEAFSQRPLPAHPALRFSAMYAPAEEESKVGGDWYDALDMPGNRVLFSIGDVAGHGIDAAVGMNRSRQALISSALVGEDPADILARVNADLLRERSPMVTAVVGYADARTYEFVYACAGHPPPVLLEPGKAPRFLDFGGIALGVLGGASYRTRRVQSTPGAMLVLYTDGAVEHSRDALEGERLLLEAVAAVDPDDAAEPATSIHRAIFSGRGAGDDVAILTVGFVAAPSQGLKVSADRADAGFVARLRPAPASQVGTSSRWRRAS